MRKAGKSELKNEGRPGENLRGMEVIAAMPSGCRAGLVSYRVFVGVTLRLFFEYTSTRNFARGVLFCLLILPALTYSQDVVQIRNGEEDIVVNPHVYVYKDKTADIHSIDKVVAAPDSAFVKNTTFQEINYGFSRPSAWCKVTIANSTDHKDWVFKIHQTRVDIIQLYMQRQSGELIKYPLTGHFQTLQERSFHSIHFGHPVSIAKNEKVVFYLFTERKFARHAAILSLQSSDYFRNYDTNYIVFISAIAGICLLATLIGVILYIFLYEKVYLLYSIYCLSFLFLILVDTGFLYAFFSDEKYQKLINNTSMIAYYWLCGCHLLFAVELLKLTKYSRWMYWLGVGTGLLFCGLALTLFFPISDTARRYISHGAYYIVFFLDVYILYALIIQLIKKEVVVYFYMAGFLVTVIGATVLILADLHFIQGINQKTDVFFIIPVIEIICMVIGLGINSSKYVKDRIKAQTQIITVQEDERKRIGQDLHDEVGNSLAAVKNMLGHERDPHLIEKEVEVIIKNVRNISHDLMPVDFKEYALADIVRHTINKFKGGAIQFEFNQTGVPVKLHAVAELVIYRIINELMTNSIKHSRATHGMIQLIYQDKHLMVMVEDNGTGMKKQPGGEKGIGLKNIRHRVAFIKATLTIETDDKGTLFIIEVPYGRPGKNSKQKSVASGHMAGKNAKTVGNKVWNWWYQGTTVLVKPK